MITAVDTNVLLDVFSADPKFGRASAQALRECVEAGSLVVCAVVVAEVASVFRDERAARVALDRLHVQFSPLDLDTSYAAADAWREYRARGGRRQRVAADFFIGAHARLRADQLLTRDRGFYKAYFRKLELLDPSVR
jgi:predicted nucleic acid-binding protein